MRLVEDEDGAPYPVCQYCPDQVAPPGTGSNVSDWAHVYQNDEDRCWYLINCQRPTKGRYGDYVATPPSHIAHSTDTKGADDGQ